MAVNLYNVTVGPTLWGYTSGEFDVVSATTTWQAVPIKRSDLSYDLKENALSLQVPDGLAPFDVWKTNVPAIPIEIEVLEYPSMAVKYRGRVIGISYNPMKGIADVKVGSTNNLANTTAPSRTYGQTCPYDLYSRQCGVSAGVHTLTLNTSDLVWVAPDKFKHPGLNGSNFTNGFVSLTTGESQFVVSHVGDTITILGVLGTVAESPTINIVMGCNKSKDECASKFGNLPRFGGFPLIPSINPVLEGF